MNQKKKEPEYIYILPKYLLTVTDFVLIIPVVKKTGESDVVIDDNDFSKLSMTTGWGMSEKGDEAGGLR